MDLALNNPPNQTKPNQTFYTGWFNKRIVFASDNIKMIKINSKMINKFECLSN